MSSKRKRIASLCTVMAKSNVRYVVTVILCGVLLAVVLVSLPMKGRHSGPPTPNKLQIPARSLVACLPLMRYDTDGKTTLLDSRVRTCQELANHMKHAPAEQRNDIVVFVDAVRDFDHISGNSPIASIGGTGLPNHRWYIYKDEHVCVIEINDVTEDTLEKRQRLIFELGADSNRSPE